MLWFLKLKKTLKKVLLFNGDYSNPQNTVETDDKIRSFFEGQNDKRSSYDFVADSLEDKVKSASDATVGRISQKVKKIFKNEQESNWPHV